MKVLTMTVLVILVECFGVEGADNSETRLIRKLMSGYTRLSRPVEKYTENVTVKVGLTPTSIDKLDPERQTFTIHGYIDIEWTDFQLQWKPTDFGNIQNVNIPANMLWLPDLVFMNDRNRLELHGEGNAMVSSTGQVFYPVRLELETDCNVVMETFPTDFHKCRIKVVSWTYNGLLLDLVKRTGTIDLSNYVPNQWRLLNTTVKRNIVSYACCVEPYPDVVFEFTVQRDSDYCRVVYGLPALILTLLVPQLFLMRIETGQKTMFGSFLFISALLLLMQFVLTIPISGRSVPIMVYNYVAILVLVSISTFLNTLIGNIYSESSNRRLPESLRIMVHGLCGFFCCRKEKNFYEQIVETDSEKHLVEGHVPAKIEWKLLAILLDRILFLIFFVIIIVEIAMFAVVFDPTFSAEE